jgi:glycosyltransferase involved in cell wall biosynthesis
MKKVSLSVLVPAYNEEVMIGESLKRLLVLGDSPHLSQVQVIIVNDASTDDTRGEIEKFLHEMKDRSHRIEWIHLDHEQNLGKGKAVQTALRHATGEISIIHDADLEYYPKDILKMLPLFIEERADAVFGSRFAASDSEEVLMFRHELGIDWSLFVQPGFKPQPNGHRNLLQSGTDQIARQHPVGNNDFRIEPELTIKLAKRKAKIFEVPINYSGRTYQERKRSNGKMASGRSERSFDSAGQTIFSSGIH